MKSCNRWRCKKFVTLKQPDYIPVLHHLLRTHGLCLGLSRWAGTRKVKSIWILLEQDTVSGSGIGWVICKSAPHSRQTTTSAPHYSVFLDWMPFLPQTNSVKAQNIKSIKYLIKVCYKFCHSAFTFVYTSAVYVQTSVCMHAYSKLWTRLLPTEVCIWEPSKQLQKTGIVKQRVSECIKNIE